MRLRKRRPNQFSLDEPVEGDDDLMPRELEDWGPSPEQRFAQTEMHEILSEVIDKLEPDFRVVFVRSEEHTSELQSHSDLVCRLLLEKKNKKNRARPVVTGETVNGWQHSPI